MSKHKPTNSAIKPFLTILFLIFYSIVFSNENDSIKIWEKMADSLHVADKYKAIDYYHKLISFSKENKQLRKEQFFRFKLGAVYVKLNSFDSGEIYLQDAIKLAKLGNYQSELADAYNDLGVSCYKRGEIAESLKNIKKAGEIYKRIKNDTLYAMSLLNAGIIYKKYSVYDRAAQNLFDAIKILKQKSLSIELASSYNTLGNIYYELDEMEKSLYFLRKALTIRKKIKHYRGVAGSLNNLGQYYKKLNELDSAEIYFEKSLQVKKELGDSTYAALTMTNIADVYKKKNQLGKAEKVLKESLVYAINSKNKEELSELLTKLADIYLEKGQLRLAKKYQHNGELLAREINNLELLKGNLSLKLELNRRANDYKKMIKTTNELRFIDNQTFNKEKNKALTEMQVKYEVEQHKKDISLLQEKNKLQEAEIENKDLRNLLLVIGIFSVSILSIFLFYIFRQRNKHNQLLRHLIVEQQHRVKNFLNTIVSVFRMHERRSNDDKVKLAVREGTDRLNAMLLIHKKLNNTIWENHDQINFSEYSDQLIKQLKQAYFNSFLKVDTTIELKKDVMLEVSNAISLGLILNEIVTNAIKYAVPYTSTPHILIQLYQEQERLVLKVQDNGPGISEEELKGKNDSLGLKLIQLFSKNLNAKLEIINNNGTVVKVSLDS